MQHASSELTVFDVTRRDTTFFLTTTSHHKQMSLYRKVRNSSNSRSSALNTGDEGNAVRISASDYNELAGSMTPTPSRGVRRRRDSDDLGLNLEDDNIIIARPAGTIPITPASKKRLKVSCEDTARLFDVDPNELAKFVEVCPISDYIKICFNV